MGEHEPYDLPAKANQPLAMRQGVSVVGEVDAPPPGNEGLGSFLQVLWRGWWLIACCVALTLGGAAYYLSQATPIYRSYGRLYVDARVPLIVDDQQQQLMGTPWNFLQTQAALIESSPIVSRAIEDGELARLPSLAGTTNRIGAIKGMLKVRTSTGDMIDVSVESLVPEDAAAIANAMLNAYIAYQSAHMRNTAQEMLKILEAEKARREEDLVAIRKQITDFQLANDKLAMANDSGALASRYNDLSHSLVQAELDAANARTALENLATAIRESGGNSRLLKFDDTGEFALGKFKEYELLIGRLDEASQALEKSRQLYTEEFPLVKDNEKKVEDIRKLITSFEQDWLNARVTKARERLEAADGLVKTLRKSTEDMRREVVEINRLKVQLGALQGEQEQARRMVGLIDERIKAIDINQEAGAFNIQIVEVARPSTTPVKPDRAATLRYALFLGLASGIGLAFLWNWSDQKIRTVDEAAELMGLPLLGTIPTIRTVKEEPARSRVVVVEPSSVAAEAYRTLRTAVYFRSGHAGSKTIVVTSALPGEGKSVTSSNLAVVMAQAGYNTLLLDCDLRKPVVHRWMGMSQSRGLTQALSGQMDLDEVIQKSDIAGLDVLTSGPVPNNPVELLGGMAFLRVLEELSKRYDRIIIDSPPLIPLADARIMSAVADATIIVARLGRSNRRAMKLAGDIIRSCHANVLGLVLNDVERRVGMSPYYYYYNEYGYYPSRAQAKQLERAGAIDTSPAGKPKD
ncbi:MAG: polysaccharide biosynthesis tyrosine autokinase [Phycisphaera sp.]|nr:polysaccharide biosynthesis tyrosine autokinase [Phycisphaera sp.]